MKISLPERRAYYAASKNEPDYLLCWIPAAELAQLAEEGRVAHDITDDYPGGLELEVSRSAFDEVELDLGVDPEQIRRAYARLLERQERGESFALPASGRVDGVWLEETSKTPESFPGVLPVPSGDIDFSMDESVPEPRMSDGQDALTVMQNL